MKRRFTALEYLIFAFIAYGLLNSLLHHLSGWIIPLIVFGGIFLLYKFPPNRWRLLVDDLMHPRRNKSSRRKTKKANFRVIHGNKRDDDSRGHRYH